MEIEKEEETNGDNVHDVPMDQQLQDPWYGWYGWVEHELGGFGAEMRGIHENVQQNCAMVQNFMQDVQARVNTALGVYEHAIFEEFQTSNNKNDEIRRNLVDEFRTASVEIQKEARSAVMEMFLSKANESGHLWHGLVEAQSQKLESSLQKAIGEVREAVDTTIRKNVEEAINSRGMAQVDVRFHEISGWIKKEIGGLGQNLDSVRKAQAKMETLLGAHVNAFTNFRDETQQRILALNQGIVLCLKQFKKEVVATSVLGSDPAVSSLREEVKNLSHGITADHHGRDYRDGKMCQKLEDLAKMLDDMRAQVNMQQEKPPNVIVVPPPVVSVTTRSTTEPGCPEPAVLGSPVEIVELEPLPGGVGGFEPNLVVVQEALLQCVENPPFVDGGGGRREIQVCPVEANHGVAATGGLNILSLPIATHLSKSQVAPRFSNKREDWTSFLHKFDSWARVISSGRVLNDQENLLLFNSCLPENLQKEMQLWEREKNRMPTYIEFRAHLEARFGRAQSENMRKKWLDVQIPRSYGKTNLQHFEEFRVNFKLAMADVLDVTSEEARRVLSEKLLPFMKRWIIEAEAKKMKNRPLVELIMKDGLSAASIQATVARWTGVTPQKVEIRGGGNYLLHFGEETFARKLLEMHGRTIQGWPKKIQVRIVEQHLNVEEIFYEVAYQMETQEKTADLQKKGPQSDYMVHEADVEHEKGRRNKKYSKKFGSDPEVSNSGGGKSAPDGAATQKLDTTPEKSSTPARPPTFREAVVQAPPVPPPAPALQYQSWGSSWPNSSWGKGYGKGDSWGKGNYGYKGGKSSGWGSGNYGGSKGYNDFQKGGKGVVKGGKGGRGVPGNPTPPTQGLLTSH